MSMENVSFASSGRDIPSVARIEASAPLSRRRARPAVARALDQTWIAAVLPLGLLGLWAAVAHLGLVKPVFLPPPWTVAKAFYELLVEQDLILDFQSSGLIVAEGFVCGTLVGLGTGIMAGLSKTVERFLGATLNGIRQVPPLAWLPLVVLWFGTGPAGKTVIIAKVVFFPVFLNTLQGIRGVSKEYVEVARVFEYKKWMLLRRVIVPAALPSIFVGIRYGAGLAWASVIAAEMLGGRTGLGFLLTHCQELLLIAEVFSIIIVIGIVGYIVDVALRKIEHILLRWKAGFEGA